MSNVQLGERIAQGAEAKPASEGGFALPSDRAEAAPTPVPQDAAPAQATSQPAPPQPGASQPAPQVTTAPPAGEAGAPASREGAGEAAEAEMLALLAEGENPDEVDDDGGRRGDGGQDPEGERPSAREPPPAAPAEAAPAGSPAPTTFRLTASPFSASALEVPRVFIPPGAPVEGPIRLPPGLREPDPALRPATARARLGPGLRHGDPDSVNAEPGPARFSSDPFLVDETGADVPQGRRPPSVAELPRAMRRRALETPVNILLIGSGGREHALAWALARSPLCRRLLVAPGNPGTARHGEPALLDVADHGAVLAFCRSHEIGLVVVGPEAPLVAGLVDDLSAAGIRAFGPGREAARLEGSKGYTKDLCAERGIPTAAFRRFTQPGPAKAYVEERGAPIVVKADGLAAGKGVVVATSVAEALSAIDMMFGGALGAAGAEVVVEEYLEGEEASFFALCDGTRAIPFGTAQDHKRVGDGDTGPNTGGMGAYSPAPILDEGLQARVMREIVEPTLQGMAERGCPYKGVLYAGLMLTAEGPKLIEYNVRLGDPECQVLMPRLRSDLVEALAAACDGALDGVELAWSDEAAVTVVMASQGYPGPVSRGSEIRGLAAAEALPGITVFQAGTRLEGDRLVADGGRVLNVTATAPTVGRARDLAYAAVARIDWPEGFCRRDIGWRAVAREGVS